MKGPGTTQPPRASRNNTGAGMHAGYEVKVNDLLTRLNLMKQRKGDGGVTAVDVGQVKIETGQTCS